MVSRPTRSVSSVQMRHSLSAWLGPIVIALVVFWPTASTFAQSIEPQLSPSEALQAAMDPFNQARSQNNDLTDADKLALSLGMTRAARDCQALTADPNGLTADAAQLLALGKLCLFGQQFEPAHAALVEYLESSDPPEPEAALVMLARAFLGLKEQNSAYAQVLTLLHDFPYDAQTHQTANNVIDASEGWDSDPEKQLNWMAADLCEKQSAATLPLLVAGKGLPAKDGDLTASALYADALRCVALARSLGDKKADDALAQLAAVVQQPNWQHTAELALMQEALSRAKMFGQAAPLVTLHAHQVNSTGALVPRTVPLRRGPIVLAAFTLWSPNAADRIRALAAAAPPHSVYAVTSASANTGGADIPTQRMLDTLRALQKTLPLQVPLLIVPDAELSTFHIDQFPAAIAIREGKVVSNAVLAGDGALRMTLLSLRPSDPKH
jgi:hypothetical protein